MMNPLGLLLLAACSTTGLAWHKRNPELTLSCPDTGSGCVLTILAPWDRSGSADLLLTNPGTDVLEISSITLQHPRFSLSDSVLSVPAQDSRTLTVTYSPDGFEPVETVLTLSTNTRDGTVTVQVLGQSDLDGDQDGYDALEAGGDDCDDGNVSIHPDAQDPCYDGVDQDCAENSDDDCDGDGHDVEARGGDDCDDTDPAIHPGASETWYDGLDADCAGDNDWDADGDGFITVEKTGGNDCDDGDAATHLGATDPTGDGVDQDCDGLDG